MSKIIEVKILPEYFNPVLSGLKTCELRKDDRDYNVGDLLILREWKDGAYTGRRLCTKITYILRGCGYGLADGYAILCIKHFREAKRNEKNN
jgi:hypothetical protein